MSTAPSPPCESPRAPCGDTARAASATGHRHEQSWETLRTFHLAIHKRAMRLAGSPRSALGGLRAPSLLPAAEFLPGNRRKTAVCPGMLRHGYTVFADMEKIETIGLVPP